MNFSDLLASSDALICKPGYGSFVEAASCGVAGAIRQPPRLAGSPGPGRMAATKCSFCREVSRMELEQGSINDALNEIWNAPRPKPVIPKGANQVAEWLAEKLNL